MDIIWAFFWCLVFFGALFLFGWFVDYTSRHGVTGEDYLGVIFLASIFISLYHFIDWAATVEFE